MTNYHITEDTFGSDCPTNWEEIADFLNSLIDRTLDQTPGAYDPGYDDSGLSADGHDVVDAIWDRFCSGDLPDAPEAVFDL